MRQQGGQQGEQEGKRLVLGMESRGRHQRVGVARWSK